MLRERQELVWIAAGQTFTLGIGFLSVKILTNIMGAASYGQLMLGISLAALINLFIYGPLGQAAMRFYSLCRERGDLGNYFCAFRDIHTRLLRTLLLPTFAMATVLQLVVGGVWPYLVAAAMLYSAIAGINHSFLSMLSGMRRRAAVAIHQSGDSAARLFGAVTAMLIVGISPAAALLGYAAGSLLVLGSLFRVAGSAVEIDLLRPQRSPPLVGTASGVAEKTLYGEIWQYVQPFLAWAAISYAFMHGDRWILQGVRGPEAVGTYVAIYQIGSALPNAIISIISQYLEPIVFERAEASGAVRYQMDGATLLQRAVLYIGLLLIVIVALASVWSREIIDLVASPGFTRNSSLLAWIVAGTGVIGIAQILTIQGLAMRQPSAYLSAKAMAALVLLGAAYIGAIHRGAEGVAMALVVAGTAYLISVLLVNARLVRYESP
jgi:O-antigen/teichoic acid export membrane protein